MKLEAWNLDDLNPNGHCLVTFLLVTAKSRDGVWTTQRGVSMACMTSTGVGVWTAWDGVWTGQVGHWVHLSPNPGPPLDLTPWHPSTESFFKQAEEQKQLHFTFLPSHLHLMRRSEN